MALSDWEQLQSNQFKFSPTNPELIGCYLKKKLLGEFDPASAPIVEVEMYGKDEGKNPWNLFGKNLPWQPYGKDATVLYVFTVLSNVGKTKQSSNKQKSRVAGDGSWRKNKERPVVGVGNTVGYHRTLTFKSDHQTVGHWNMDEFAIDPSAFPGELQGHELDLVLCRISSKGSNSTTRNVEASKKRKSVVLDDDDSCISDVERPTDLMDEATSSKRQRVAVPQEQVPQEQEQTAYVPINFDPNMPEYEPIIFNPNMSDSSEYVQIDFNFNLPDSEFVDEYFNFDDLE